MGDWPAVNSSKKYLRPRWNSTCKSPESLLAYASSYGTYLPYLMIPPPWIFHFFFFWWKIFGSSRAYKTSSSKLWNSFSSLFFYVWLKKLNLRTVLKSFWCRSGPSLYPLKPCISSWSLPARRYSCPYLGGKGSYQISQELNVFWHLRNFASWKCPSFDFLKKWEKKRWRWKSKKKTLTDS